MLQQPQKYEYGFCTRTHLASGPGALGWNSTVGGQVMRVSLTSLFSTRTSTPHLVGIPYSTVRYGTGTSTVLPGARPTVGTGTFAF